MFGIIFYNLQNTADCWVCSMLLAMQRLLLVVCVICI